MKQQRFLWWWRPKPIHRWWVMENNKKCRWESIKQQPRITKRIMLKMAVLLLSRKYQSQHCQYRRDNIAYLDNCWGRGRSERRIYDFACANDLGLQQRTELGEGSECNLLNYSIFMKVNLIMIKLEWSTTSPKQHEHALYNLYPYIYWSLGLLKQCFDLSVR